VANLYDNTVSILLGNGAGGFANKTDFATGVHPVSLAIGDLNGDGKPDLVTADESDNAISVLLNNTPFTDVSPTSPVVDFALGPVAPNPSWSEARVPFALPRQARVGLRVVDVAGATVAVLADGVFPAGHHEAKWNGMRAGDAVPAGVYFVRYQAGGKTFLRRLVRIR
jgi:hypothetical protein